MSVPVQKLRIGMLIRSLTVGGAERQLVKLAIGLRAAGQEVTVLVYYRAGSFLEDELVRAGVPLVDLRKAGRWDVPGFVRRLRGVVRQARLDVVYSFLPTSNVLAAILWGGRGTPAVIWGVRGAIDGKSDREWLGTLAIRAQDAIAWRASAIVVNSLDAVDGCKRRGWPATRLHVVANGLDPDEFRFDVAGREELRAAWGLGNECLVIGVAGRIDPVKDIGTLLEAFVRLAAEMPNLHLVIAGEGRQEYLQVLRERIRESGLEARVRWLGLVREMRGFYSAIDLLCLPSRSEGCSNVLAEALACGTAVVATRVGDNAVYVQDPAMLSGAGSPGELTKALRHALAGSRRPDRDQLRRQILEQLATSVMVDRTMAVLRGATLA